METQEIKDFSISAEPIRFRVSPDVFEAFPVLSLPVTREMAKLGAVAQAAGGDASQMAEKIDVFLRFFDQVLYPASARRFAERAKPAVTDDMPDEEKARVLSEGLDLQRQIMPIFQWLLEQYGLRPTAPSSTSSAGSTDGGTASTAGAQPAESTPTASLPAAS
jgi:hypothetical protein